MSGMLLGTVRYGFGTFSSFNCVWLVKYLLRKCFLFILFVIILESLDNGGITDER